MFLYFAYGSNMSRRQMRERCPDHECLGKAVLKDHALCFPRHSTIRNCGVAGLEERPGAEVWGVVYRLHDGDLAALNRFEGFDPAKPVHESRYNRSKVSVMMNDTKVECLTYFARPEPGVHAPNAEYLATIIKGAVENGFPSSYINFLSGIAK